MRIRLTTSVSPKAQLVAGAYALLLLLVGCAEKSDVDSIAGAQAAKSEDASLSTASGEDGGETVMETGARDKLQEELTALYDRKTEITAKITANQRLDLSAKTADVNATVVKQANSTTASGLDTLGSGTTVALSAASGNWFGAAVGGFKLLKSGAQLAKDVKIAQEANAVKAQSAETVKLTTAQEAALKKELATVDAKIAKLEKQLEKESKVSADE